MKTPPLALSLFLSIGTLLILQGCGLVERPPATPPTSGIVTRAPTRVPSSSPGVVATSGLTPTAIPEPSPIAMEAGLIRLTDDPAPDGFPAWSSDGEQIAFISERDGFPELYVMNSDGTEPTRLSQDSFHRKLSPSWRPGTRQIALAVVVDTVQVFLVDVDRSRALPFEVGLGLRPVSPVASNSWDPSWSPDGQRLALSMQDDVGDYQVFVMNADGSGRAPLTEGPALDRAPAWSPDGKTIVFVSDRDGNRELYLVRLNEEGLTRLTRDPASEGIASWSPDGKRLVFSSDRDGDWDLYLLSLANGAARRLTSDPGTDSFPAWSPDGKAIAFVSDRAGNAEIYLMDAPTLED